jgi:chorismate dehydratase
LADSASSQDLPAVFRQSRDHGLEPASLNQIASEWAPRLGIGQSDVHSYLTKNIYFYLDAACLEGLQLFYRFAAEIGALPAAPDMNFVGTANVCIAQSRA